jgi:hypothetical protein
MRVSVTVTDAAPGPLGTAVVVLVVVAIRLHRTVVGAARPPVAVVVGLGASVFVLEAVAIPTAPGSCRGIEHAIGVAWCRGSRRRP